MGNGALNTSLGKGGPAAVYLPTDYARTEDEDTRAATLAALGHPACIPCTCPWGPTTRAGWPVRWLGRRRAPAAAIWVCLPRWAAVSPTAQSPGGARVGRHAGGGRRRSSLRGCSPAPAPSGGSAGAASCRGRPLRLTGVDDLHTKGLREVMQPGQK